MPEPGLRLTYRFGGYWKTLRSGNSLEGHLGLFPEVGEVVEVVEVQKYLHMWHLQMAQVLYKEAEEEREYQPS
ncbi:hypothetical protein Taro_022177 [Colocasia esculenta]|uniref:Uncharacterized protein n=1 Tax=Colocasia esculenta TaxID=4460 RepID=A0A843V4M3_COLES|nr:hypothetical protein [Colocasia esculenta]